MSPRSDQQVWGSKMWKCCNEKREVVNSDDVQLPNGETISNVGEEGYKYLGMLEIDEFMNHNMKALV